MSTDTFLNICKEVHDKLGMQGTLTTVDTSGYQKVLVDLVSTTWRDLQHSRKDFYFLRAKKQLVIGQNTTTFNLSTASAASGVLDNRLTITGNSGGHVNIEVSLVAGGTAGSETVTRDSSNNIIVAIENGVSTETQICTQIALESDIASATTIAGATVWTLGVGADKIRLEGGAHAIFSTAAEYNRFGTWRTHKFMYDNKALKYVAFDEWETDGRYTQTDKPTHYTIDPSNDNIIFQNLSQGRLVTLHYIKSAHVFSDDTDVPEVPIVDRDVIVWAGLLACAEEFGNHDAQNKGTVNYEKTLGVFYRHQIPSEKVNTPSMA